MRTLDDGSRKDRRTSAVGWEVPFRAVTSHAGQQTLDHAVQLLRRFVFLQLEQPFRKIHELTCARGASGKLAACKKVHPSISGVGLPHLAQLLFREPQTFALDYRSAPDFPVPPQPGENWRSERRVSLGSLPRSANIHERLVFGPPFHRGPTAAGMLNQPQFMLTE